MAKKQPESERESSGSSELWDAAAAEGLDGNGTAGDAPASSGQLDSESIRQQYEQQLQDAETRVLRAQAETENARRRMRRDFDDQLRYATLPLVQDLIDVVDNLDRALAAAESGQANSIADGIKMVQTQLDAVLEKHGCRRIPAAPGTEFDPALHSALQMQPHPEIPANHIAMETRAGFRLYDRVVRPANVIISTGPGP
jgi:molecular chaperone GrpE